MPKTNVEELVVKMSADLAEYQRKMLKAQGVANRTAGLIVRDFNSANKKISGMMGSMGASFKSFGLGMVAALSFEKVSSAAIQAVKDIAEIGDTAESVGISVEALQALQRMAVASGTDVDTLRKGVQSLAEQSAETGSALDKLFRANGFDVKSMNMDQIIAAFGDLVKNAGTAKDQLAIITAVMGDKVGRELVEAFRTGAAGQREALNQMLKDGDYHSKAEVKRIQDIEEAYNAVTQRIATRWQSMIISMVGAYDTVAGLIESNPMTKPGLGIQDKPGFDLGPDAGGFFVPNPYYKRPTVSDNPDGTAKAWKPSDNATTVNPKNLEDAADATSKLAGKQKWLNDTWKAGKTDAVALGEAQDAQVDAYRRAQSGVTDYIQSLAEEKAALELEIATFGMSLDQKAKAEAIAKIPLAASEAQRQAAIAEAEAIAALQRQYEALQEQQRVAAEINDAFQAAFVDGVMDIAHGKNVLDSLEKALGSVADKLLEMAANKLFENAFGGLFGGGSSGGGGFLSSLLGGGGGSSGGFFASLFGSLFSTAASLYHSGGIAGQGGGQMRNVHPGMFAGAPRYHAGGIAGLKPGEIPAILQRGELVVPRGGVGGGSKAVTINVNLSGANGDAAIYRIANKAVRDGIRGYTKARPASDLERTLRME